MAKKEKIAFYSDKRFVFPIVYIIIAALLFYIVTNITKEFILLYRPYFTCTVIFLLEMVCIKEIIFYYFFNKKGVFTKKL